MTGNYGYPNYYNRPHDPSHPQARQPPPGAQVPQYGHGHQTYAAHQYSNVPAVQYMPQYPPQYGPPPFAQQPSYPNERHIDYPSYAPSQPPPPNQPPRPAPSAPDQFTPVTAGPPMYNAWNDRNSPQAPRRFDEDEEKSAAVSAFKRFDQDGGGYLDLQEFMDALRALHLSIAYHEALECFRRCDVNEDGRITQDEFVRIYVNEKRMRPQSEAYYQPPGNPPPAPMRP